MGRSGSNIRARSLALGQSPSFKFDPDIIEIEDGLNERDMSHPSNIAHIRGLADSIKQDGLLIPIRVRYVDKRVILVDGQMRLHAVRLLRSEGVEIPAIAANIEPKGINERDRLIHVWTANTGKGFEPLEQARIIRRMMAWEWTKAQVAQRLGVSVSTVENRLSLLEAPHEVQQLVKEQVVDATTVSVAVRRHGAEGARERITAAVEKAKDEDRTHVSASDLDDGTRLRQRISRAKVEGLVLALQSIWRVADEAITNEALVKIDLVGGIASKARDALEAISALP